MLILLLQKIGLRRFLLVAHIVVRRMQEGGSDSHYVNSEGKELYRLCPMFASIRRVLNAVNRATQQTYSSEVGVTFSISAMSTSKSCG